MKGLKEAGLTLIETLAVTVIASIVLLFLYSIISQSSNTYKKQTDTNKEIYDAAYALKVITKEIRKFPTTVSIECNNNLDPTNTCDTPENRPRLEITTDDVQKPKIIFEFDHEHKVIKKDGVTLTTGIQDFQVSHPKLGDSPPVPNKSLITIQITNLHGKTYATEIALRKERSY